MRTIILAALVTGLAAAPAAASVVVLGNSAGASCYQAAKAKNMSLTALSYCNDALATDAMDGHDTVATYVNRDIIEALRKDYPTAMKDFDKAIAKDPAEPESYLNKGSTMLWMGGSPEQAIPLLDEALNRKTTRPELAYYSRGIAHELARDVKAAYQDYRQAQELAPEWADPARELTRFKVVKASASGF